MASAVVADADPFAVADAMIAGMNFAWCGQSCGSTSRAFIHARIYDAVLEHLRRGCTAIRPGLPTEPETKMGAIGSRSQFERILAMIETGRKDGARLLAGGGRPTDPKLANGFFIDPTVFMDVTVTNDQIDQAIPRVQGIPAIDTQAAETKVLINDGGTVVIGGIIVTNQQTDVKQVPLFGSIPAVGNLFKHTTVSSSAQELLFFLTPRIMPS